MQRNPKILAFVGVYLPGYKAGGPLRTIANMVEQLSDDFEFWIVTRDRDLGDDSPYTDVIPNTWCEVGKARVFYCSPQSVSISGFAALIRETPHDVLYLNSFFDPHFTFKVLLARRLRKFPPSPLVLAPRGEFSRGALHLKKTKKRLFVSLAHSLGIYGDITWHASSVREAQDIARAFKVKEESIRVALDVPARVGDRVCPVRLDEVGETRILRIAFLSRISPKKNLDYALLILARVKADVQLDIYGPVEDAAYWKKCQILIAGMPENIRITYGGSVRPDQVQGVFAQHDLFFFPTQGENYGHAIAEALTAGTPVLISDQTPWRDLKTDRLGWDLKLEDRDGFSRIIEDYSRMTRDEKNEWRSRIRHKIVARLADPGVLEANRQLFWHAMKQGGQEAAPSDAGQGGG